MQHVWDPGRYPNEPNHDVVERQLAEKLRKARKAMQFSPEQGAELQLLRAGVRPSGLAPACSPPRTTACASSGCARDTRPKAAPWWTCR